MYPFNVHRGPVPNPLTLRAGQIVLTASVYPDERQASTGGFHLKMDLEQAVGVSLRFDPRPIETYETRELAEARALSFAAECQVTDIFIDTR